MNKVENSPRKSLEIGEKSVRIMCNLFDYLRKKVLMEMNYRLLTREEGKGVQTMDKL